MKISLTKKDVCLWASHKQLPEGFYTSGCIVTLPGGEVLEFVPMEGTKIPALKPVKVDKDATNKAARKAWTGIAYGTTVEVAVEER